MAKQSFSNARRIDSFQTTRLLAASIMSLLLASTVATAQSYEVVVDFGDPAGRQPKGGLVEAANGCVYGTTISGGASNGTIFKSCSGTTTTVFMFSGANGSYPESGLIDGGDGYYYGTTRFGGAGDKGTVYRFQPTTQQLNVLHSFSGANGAEPRSALLLAADGRLYGVTSVGGAANHGSVFAIQRSGSGFVSLKSFSITNGRIPIGRLVQTPDGMIYGTTSGGGATLRGTIFRMTTAGALTTLRSFAGPDGASPNAGLTVGPDGNLYGSTMSGGATNQGTLFRLTQAGNFTVLRSFAGSNGAYPAADLLDGGDGFLYGTTTAGGTHGGGVVFKTDTTGALTVLRSLAPVDGKRPESALMRASNGRLYGTAVSDGPAGASGTLFQLTVTGTFVCLHAFSGTPAQPRGMLFRGADDRLYGTSFLGGSADAGTIFRLTPGVSLEVLYELDGLSEGQNLHDGITQANDGTLYGSTIKGGTYDVGQIFKLGLNGAYTPLGTLTETGSTGYFPYSAPVQGKDGSFYGVMSAGAGAGAGAIYKMTSAGALSTVFTFGGNKGRVPYGRLAVGADGTLYGTTALGGSTDQGTLFSFDPDTKIHKVLHSFSGPDGAVLYSGVIVGSDDRLYGVTYRGGANGFGTVFAYDTGTGQRTTLHSFNSANGAYPYSTLVEASDGRLYGTTYIGGAKNRGAVFSIAKNGSGFTLKHSLQGSDGSYPYGGLVEASDGYLYGTAPSGGSANNGVIFRVSLGGSTTTPPPDAPTNLVATVPSSTSVKLTWVDASNDETEFRIERCQGATCTAFAQIATVGANVETFTDTPVASGTTYRYRVRAANSGGASSPSAVASATTTSAGTRSVTVTAPNTAVNWAVGSIQKIKWNYTGPKTSPMRVEVSRDGGTSWTIIAASVANSTTTTGSYNWKVTAPNTGGARIRVTFTDDPASDASDANFTIADPYITITSPTSSSTVFTVGTNATIKWKSNLGLNEDVKIELSLNGGQTYPIVIAASTPADGQKVATVQSSWISTAARVRITWLNNATVVDTSNQNFTIK